MRRTAWILSVAFSAWVPLGYSQAAPTDSFVGDWHPIGAPEDLTRVVVEHKGTSFTIRVWSQCVLVDCDWGTSSADVSVDSSSLSASFSQTDMGFTAEFVLLTDGSLQVTTHTLLASPKKKGDGEDVHVAYFTKNESEVPLGLPIRGLAVENTVESNVRKTSEVPTAKVSEAGDQTRCTLVLDPPVMAFDRIGGDVSIAVHAPRSCPWTLESDVPWLSAASGQSGAGEGVVVIHATTNTDDSRAGSVTVGGVFLPASQHGFDRVQQIPGLSFGSNHWSIVRITNSFARSRPVKIDVYQESGDRVPIDPLFNINPQETLEVVIETRQIEIYRRGGPDAPRVLGTGKQVATLGEGSAWVRIAETNELGIPDLEVRAVVEVLSGNQISDFKRAAQEPRDMSGPVTIRASEVRGRRLYFLNLSDGPTTVSFCAASKVRPDPCSNKDSSATRAVVKPNQFVVVDVKNITQKYFCVESSNPGRTILAEFVPAQGTTQVFSSESSINFGEPAR